MELELLTLEKEKRWLEILELFPAADVYYLPAYLRAWKINGDGEPLAVYYEDADGRVFYPFMVREIASLSWLKKRSDFAGYADIITPYGYGGPLIASPPGRRKKLLANFRRFFDSFCREKKFICEFVRFHPLLENHRDWPPDFPVEFNRYTVVVDLREGEEGVWREMSSACRNRIRKARQKGLEVRVSPGGEEMEQFLRLYYLTMEKVGASSYYFFPEEHFSALAKLAENLLLLQIQKDGETIAAGLFFVFGPFMAYHLGGSEPSFLKYAPNNLLLFAAALAGIERGASFLHLGGGFTEKGEDSLFRFKKSFAPRGLREFWVGKKIHLPEAYYRLVCLYREFKQTREATNGFFPLYRAREGGG